MSIVHAIVLGITQGLSEYLPISSSGHLILVPWLFGWDDFAGNESLKKTFDVALHLGTLVGAVAYFRHDIVRLRGGGARTRSRTTAAWPGSSLLSAVPAAIIGAAVRRARSRTSTDQIWLIARDADRRRPASWRWADGARGQARRSTR